MRETFLLQETPLEISSDELAKGDDEKTKIWTAERVRLVRRGACWYGAIPNMRDDWLANLMAAFDAIVSEHAVSQEVSALI